MFDFLNPSRKKQNRERRRKIAIREYHRARRRFSRYVRRMKKRYQEELRQVEEDKNRELQEERQRIEKKLEELNLEKKRWADRNDILRKKIQTAEEEISSLKEARSQMEASFSLVGRAMSLANNAADEIDRSSRKIGILGDINESD